MLKRLYDWTLRLAERPSAEIWLFVIAFVESSIFLVPAEVLFLPMAIAKPERVWRYGLIAAVGSILGGVAGWMIGYYAFETIARPVLEFYGKLDEFESMKGAVSWELIMLFLITSGAAHLPPLKIVTILSGVLQVNLLGFSLGSFISQQIALTTPGIVNKMILTGTGPKGAVGLSNFPALLAAGANLSAAENFLKFGFTTSDESVAKGKAAWSRIQQRVQDRDAPVSQASAAAQVTAVLGWAQAYAKAAEELNSITQPVLIVQGKEDVPVPVGNAEFMAEHIPNAQLIVYPDAAHAALFQYPAEFVQSVITFIEQ